MTSLEKYAKLLIETGVNIQEGQTLVIKAPIEAPEFARLCARFAYEAGAREVVMRWIDGQSNRLFYEYADDEVFDETNEWFIQYNLHYAFIDSAFLFISAEDPELMKGIDPSKFSRTNKAYAEPLKPYQSRIMSNKNAWCVASIPTEAWAKKVFPDLNTKEAMEALWQAILTATRADLDDPVAAWKAHQENLNQKLEFLNTHQFKALRYKNSIGTDVLVELPKGHIWYGGSDKHIPKNYNFVANMPTEEVYTLPKYNGVNGKIVSSYPLNYNGLLIQDFWFEFKDGIVVDYDAKENKDALRELLSIDEGAKRLGEVALVPFDSPISNTGILFYNTLFDENASCHFALGEAYPICIKNGEDMTDDELNAHGANTSDTHVDFMIGTEDLSIEGLTYNNEVFHIFKQGNFVI